MQEWQVGWDLISLYKIMSREATTFVLYLAFVLVFSFLRSLRLARKFWLFSPERRGSSHQPNLGTADLLATGALANNLARAKELSDESPETSLQIVKAARPRFEYLWEQSAAKVAVMKNLSILTLILSGLVLSYDLMGSLRWFLQIQNRSQLGNFAGGPDLLPVTLVLGFAVSAVLYALSTVFGSVLARRKAEWNLFVANVKDQHEVD